MLGSSVDGGENRFALGSFPKTEVQTTFVLSAKIRTRGIRSGLVPKNFQDSPSHVMFGHIHEALNVDEKKN
jgi:hypothetical protein